MTLEMATRQSRATEWKDPKSPTPGLECLQTIIRERNIPPLPWVFCYLYSYLIITNTEGLEVMYKKLYSFHRADLTNDHKLGGLERQKFYFLTVQEIRSPQSRYQ